MTRKTDDKHPTQAMADDGKQGALDGTNRPSGPPDAGPRPPASKHGFRGGQSVRDYHGAGQLGDEPVDDDPNPNAPAGSD